MQSCYGQVDIQTNNKNVKGFPSFALDMIKNIIESNRQDLLCEKKMSCHVMLCYVMLYYFMLCYVALIHKLIVLR